MSDRFMPGVIAVILLGYFGFALFGPSVVPGMKAPSDALVATLVNLTIAAVAYFIGTTQGSATKTQLLAQRKDPQ